MVIRQFISGVYKKVFGYRYRVVERTVNGQALRVHDGTIRDKADKDDTWFVLLAKQSQVIFDVGANIGYTGLLANLYAKPLHMVLVDPNPLALSSAATNLIMNSLSANCRFVTGFVSDKEEDKVKFYTVGRGAAGSIYPEHAKSAVKMNAWYWVSTTTIDALVRDLGVVPDLVKIDVEGAEQMVLGGALKTAAAGKTSFMIEMHSNADLRMADNADKVLQWCNNNKYEAWYLKEGTRLATAMIAHRGRCHILLQPAGKPFPAALQGVKESAPLP